MNFTSIRYVAIFSLIFAAYYKIPHKWRWAFLLGASYAFYALWNWKFLPLIWGTTFTSYITAIQIEKQGQRKLKQRFLAAGAAFLLAPLFLFKYTNFFISNVNRAIGLIGLDASLRPASLILPLGISFYTFQLLGYLIDVYRGRVKAERHYGIFSLFASFFPQFIAGPIERAGKLLHQLREEAFFDYSRSASMLKRIAWGFLKKTVIADGLVQSVNKVFNTPSLSTGFMAMAGAVLFSIQIYADFSACSDIAIGCAGMLGINLSENFRQPHFAASISEFWSRWHMTLSNWLRDYIYIPLCKGKKKRWQIYLAIIATFLASGFWHGAGWRYLIWGFIHGIYLVASNMTKKLRKNAVAFLRLDKAPKLHGFLQIAMTFSLVCFSRIFFRANSVEDAFVLIKAIFVQLSTLSLNSVYVGVVDIWMLFSNSDIVIFFFFFAVLESFQYLERKYGSAWSWLGGKKAIFRFAAYIFIAASIILFSSPSQSFFYNQF
ncbi:MAG: MBOAT family protein [Clostridiales bacterium]|jgi:D-alanyl-lipoteichoic acid acyltransferase DltB (MBOAT superfamily)|nr:MBOAT family protein [Clostridiales bacterium]